MSISTIPQVQALLIAWAYVKKYAWIFFAVLAGVLAFVLLRKGDPTDLAQQLDAINKRHADEIKAIQEADAEQLAAHAANEKKLQEALALLDERYKQQLNALDEQKRADVAKILAESGNDPKALADALAKQLDLQVKSP
jgi:uncharacterized membrane protein